MSRCQKAYKRYGIITILSVIKMVSWGFAIKKGAIIFLWTIVWGIIGGIIGAALGGTAFIGILMNPAGVTPESILGAFLGMMAGVLIGSIITSILVFATILKITMESTLEEAKKP